MDSYGWVNFVKSKDTEMPHPVNPVRQLGGGLWWGEVGCGQCPHIRLRTGPYIGRTGPDSVCFGGSLLFARAGTRFESHLGHSVSAGQELFGAFFVWTVSTLSPLILCSGCVGSRIDLFGFVEERLPTADRVPPCGVSSGYSSLFFLPLGFRVHHFMVARAAYNMIC